MRRMSPLPSVIQFNQLLSSVVKLGEYSAATCLFRDFCNFGIAINECTMTIAINTYCLSNRVDYGFSILGSFYKRGCVPSAFTFSTLLKGLFRENGGNDALELFTKIVGEGWCEINVVVYGTVIDGLCKSGGVAAAMELLRIMEKGSCKPNIHIYNMVIDALCKDKLVDSALKLFDEMSEKVFWCGERTMEGGDQTLGNGGSRWNPTKEQINMLESLYKQGLRTPTAEQIQHITARLRDFGHIEGKNVFYWFQNHKARQRQKQKQESFAYYNRFLHATPVFPPYQNVVCSPCYIPPPKNDQVFYHQHPKVQLPTASGSFKRSRITPESVDTSKQQPTRYNTNLHSFSTPRNSSIHHQETLDLFPIHPTGILHHSTNNGTLDLDHDHDHDHSQIKNPSFAAKNPPKERGGSSDDHPFFDFFCGN